MSEVLARCMLCDREAIFPEEIQRYFALDPSSGLPLNVCKNCIREYPQAIDDASPIVIVKPSIPDSIKHYDKGPSIPVTRKIVKQRGTYTTRTKPNLPPWTPKQTETLKQLYTSTPIKELSKIIGRSTISIASKAGRLGLKRHPDLIKPVPPRDITSAQRFELFCQKEWGLPSKDVNDYSVASIYEDEIRIRAETHKSEKAIPKAQLQALRDIGVFLPNTGTRTFVDLDRFNQVLQHPCIKGCRDPDAPETPNKASYPELIEATI